MAAVKHSKLKCAYNPQICGECGQELPNRVSLNNHFDKHRDNMKIKRRLDNTAENNPCWKGDNIGYISIHKYVRSIKPKSKTCERCKKEKVVEMANITGVYTRNPDDYIWLCDKCHFILDDRQRFLRQFKGDAYKE